MNNRSIMVSALLMLVIAVATAGTASAAGFELVSVVRDIPDTPVSPGEEITVGLTQDGFLMDVAEVTEYLPDGFVYVTGSFTGYKVEYNPGDNTLVMYLASPTETYSVTAGSAEQIRAAKFIGFFDGIYDSVWIPVSGQVTGNDTLELGDEVLPTINSVELDETDVTTGDPILVTVDATDNVGVDGVTAEGVELAPQGGDIWTGVIITVEGTHTVHVCARDAAGNVAWNNSTSYTATDLDTESPVVNSVELDETEVTTGDPILVTVDATDNVGVDGVTAEGVELAPQGGDIWTGVIITVEGAHTVHVCARDAAGNVAWNNSTSYTATDPDTESPVVNSVELDETEVTTGDPILVTVDATDNVGVDGVTAEGVELAPQGGNIWAGVIIAEVGTHPVNICARDAAGNVAWNNSTSYTATDPDTESPVVNSVELNETEVTTGDPILITVDATDNVGVDGVTAEGVGLAPQGGNIWAGCIMAGLGENIVHVSARDAAGNVGWNNSTSYNGEWGNGPNISISITPALKNVSAGGTFTINITVDPNATAIQGAQADLIFDPNVVTVDSLSNVGEIFEGHSTFETVYSIDNVTGVVLGIGSAIIDGGSVTSAGVLATVTLTVNGSATGDSALELINTEVTVDGIPVRPPDLMVNNGTLIIDTIEPDLIVESITPNCGGYLFGNESNEVCAVIKNNGTGNAEASHACFVLNGYSETVSVSPLDAGASETVCITDPTIRNAGDAVTITVTADCNSEVGESNETNNASTLDTTVVNNGYKGKRYTGGEDITTLATYDINGNLVYSVGDSYYRGGYSGWSTPSYTANWTASDIPVPVGATIEEVRLYVPYCFDYQGDMPDNLSLKFNGNAQTLEKHYTDRKSYGSWDNPYGMLTYNVTDDFDTSGNIANLTNSNPKCCEQKTVSIRGMVLMVIYEDATEPRRQIYVNEEFDLLYGGSGKCTTPEEATAWAPITGPTIDTSETASARLITFAHGADGPEGELIFNGQVWNDVWSFAGDTQIGIDERDVALYLESTDNLVGFQSNGDYMEASNAILVVEYGEPVLNMTVTATPPSVTVNNSTSVVFNVTSDGSAVDGALVTLSGCGVDTNDTTGVDGTVTIEVNATSTGTINVIATKDGYATAETTVTVEGEALCPGDFTGDGYVNTDDVVYMVVNLWGPCTPGAEGDFTGDGYVNTDDVVYMVVNLWGPCP